MRKISKRKIKLFLIALIVCVSVYVNETYTNQHTATNYEVKTEATTINDYKCVDGDTFWINGEKIRLLAIDAPESTNRIDPYGKEASAFVCNILSNATTVRLEQDKGNEIDKYNRSLYWVFLDDTFIQSEIIRNGYAEIKYVDKKTVNKTYLSLLEKAQQEAQQEKINIWS